MDTITAAILAAVAVGAFRGASTVTEQALVNTYSFLRELIIRKFGTESDLAKAVEGLEAKPNSAARKELVAEEIEATKANQDPELVRAAQRFLSQYSLTSPTSAISQQAIGNQIAQAADSSIAALNVDTLLN